MEHSINGPSAYLTGIIPSTPSDYTHSSSTSCTHSLKMIKIVVVLSLVALALAAPADPYGHQPTYKEEPRPYNYAYGVQDEYAGTDFGHTEDSDGKSVKGSYTVQLPDGRKQTVNYVADHYGGYQAEVSYYGEAQYPKEYGPPITFKPQAYHQPSYQPAPTYN